MDYKRFDDTILVRMDRGEEILEQVKAVALKEHVALASVQALGAINDFTVGVYNVAEKVLRERFQGQLWLVADRHDRHDERRILLPSAPERGQ
ncbi:MAG: PCC domain-containing protein [Butyricicoccus sp.]